jgi:hypothetical protein
MARRWFAGLLTRLLSPAKPAKGRRTFLKVSLGVAGTGLLALGPVGMAEARRYLMGSRAGANDIGDWTAFTPTEANPAVSGGFASYANQTGSWLYFVDPSQTVVTTMLALDEAAQYRAAGHPSGANPHGGPYVYHDGKIKDMDGNEAPLTGPYAGVPYGTDPLNPSASVKWFKRVSYCLYNQFGNNRWNGTVSNGSSTTAGTHRYNASGGRIGRNDWIGIKGGTSLALEDDLLDLALEGNPALLANNQIGSLVLPGGSSGSGSLIYGTNCAALGRARITKMPRQGFVNRWGGAGFKGIEHLHYLSLEFDGYDRSHYTGHRVAFNYSNQVGTAGVCNTTFEDVLIHGTTGITHQTNSDFITKFRRCFLLDTYWDNSVHSSGLFTDNTGDSAVQWYDSIIARNGKTNAADPRISGGTDHPLSRNLYLSGECDPAQQVFDNCVILAGASGDQARAGGTFTRCYFMLSELVLAGQNGTAHLAAKANTGLIQRCVNEMYNKSGSTGNIYAKGLGVFFGAHHVDISDNVITDAGMSSAQRTANTGGYALSTGGITTGWYHPQLGATEYNDLHDNFVIIRHLTRMYGSLTEGINQGSLVNFQDGNGSATWNMDGRVYTLNASLVAFALTGAVAAGGTAITLNSVTGLPITYSGYPFPDVLWNIGIVQTDGSTHWSTLTTAPTGTSLTLVTPMTVGANSGALVTIAVRDSYTYPCNRLNLYRNNTTIGQSDTNPNSKDYNLSLNGKITPTDTRADTNSYTGSTHRTVVEAAGLGYDIDRCYSTYLTSIGEVVGSTNQDTIIAYMVAKYSSGVIRKGSFAPKWLAVAPINHVRAGVGLSAIA